MSDFGDLVKTLRKEKGLTLDRVARKIGSQKGYVSGIENGKVNPPSVKIIRKFARLFGQDVRTLVRMAWADKAPAMIREEARQLVAVAEAAGAGPLMTVPLINTVSDGYPAELTAKGRLEIPACSSLVLPQGKAELAATVCDDSMEEVSPRGLSRGDVVLLSRLNKLRSGIVAYVVFTARHRRRALLRNVVLEEEGRVVLQPLNKEYSAEFLRGDDVEAVYLVVGKIEMYKKAFVEAAV